MLRSLAAAAALLLATSAQAQTSPVQDRVGDVHEIRLRKTTESATDDGGSTSSSSSNWMLIERVVAARDEGLELEFDLPPDTTAEARAREWQWPARVLRSPDGSLQLLNVDELETRLETWLAAFEIPREACGRWIFTWDAFKIECDPQSVLDTIKSFDLRVPDLREGAAYGEPGALAPAMWRRESAGPEGSNWIVETQIDPEFIRRERADQDVVVAEIMGEPTTLEAALQARSEDRAMGTISTTLTTDADGQVLQRTTVIRLAITDAAGGVERSTSTADYQRRAIDERAP